MYAHLPILLLATGFDALVAAMPQPQTTTPKVTLTTSTPMTIARATPTCTIPAAACASPKVAPGVYLPEPCFPNKGVCYPTNYYAAQDEGQMKPILPGGTINNQLNLRCQMACDQQSRCLSYVAVENMSPNGLGTGTCFFYAVQFLTPRQCADSPSGIQAFFKQTVCTP